MKPPRDRRARSAALLGAACLAVLASAGAAHPVGAQIRYTGSLAYSRGSYFFEQSTASVYSGHGLSVDWGRVTFSATVPFIVQQQGAVTWVAGSPIPTGGTQHGLVAGRTSGSTVGTRRGRRDGGGQDSVLVVDSSYSARVGDPLLGIGAEIYSGFGVVRSVRAEARVKAPTSDLDDGVGTGEWDYGGGASVALGLGKVLGFADATYWWLGDLPDLELLDRISYGLGLAMPISDQRATVLLGVSGSSKTIPTADVPISLDGSVGISVGRRGFLTFGVSVGATETAADLAVQGGFSTGIFGSD